MKWQKLFKDKKIPWVYIIAVPGALLGWVVAAVVWLTGRAKPQKKKKK